MLDFCIIGAPKSGTTSIFNWLDAHPEVQGATPKETHFLMDPEHPLCGIHGTSYHTMALPNYAQRFFPEKSKGRMRFEATPHYFYQRTARSYLTSLQPQPLVVMLLREPADRILSSFRFTRDNLAHCEPSLSFDQFVKCLLNDQTSELDKFFHNRGSLYIAKRELELSRYCEWLEWWSERLERDRLEVILFDELKHDPRGIMTHLCQRLGINAHIYDEMSFTQDNPTYPVGKRTIHRIIRPMSSLLPGGSVKQRLKQKYLEWQRVRAKPDSNYELGLQNLRDFFMPYNKILSDRFDIDIRCWHNN